MSCPNINLNIVVRCSQIELIIRFTKLLCIHLVYLEKWNCKKSCKHFNYCNNHCPWFFFTQNLVAFGTLVLYKESTLKILAYLMPVVFWIIHQILFHVIHLALWLSDAWFGKLISEYLLFEKLVAILGCVFFRASLLVLKLCCDSEVWDRSNCSSSAF